MKDERMRNVKEKDIDKITEAFYLILKGKKPTLIELPKDYPDCEIKQAVGYINEFINAYNPDEKALPVTLPRCTMIYVVMYKKTREERKIAPEKL
jgi:thiamine pyrophosphate-dependent acetolactate synthase large subunit-like protein